MVTTRVGGRIGNGNGNVTNVSKSSDDFVRASAAARWIEGGRTA